MTDKNRADKEIAMPEGDLNVMASAHRAHELKTLSGRTGPESPAIAAYKADYDRLRLPTSVKARFPWKTIVQGLLENGGEKLKLAEAMQGGGQLFYIDDRGTAYFKDKGVEPVMFGYDKERPRMGDRLLQIYDRDPEAMKKVKQWGIYDEIRQQVQGDGYQLFSDDGKHHLGAEMKKAQEFTGRPFVASGDGNQERSALLESGKKPRYVKVAVFRPMFERVHIDGERPDEASSNCGTFRLLTFALKEVPST